jgi:integrase
MKTRFRLIRRGVRGDRFYCVDTATGKRHSLKTSDEDQAQELVKSKNDAVRKPEMNLQMAQVYLHHSDAALSTRTWQFVMEQIVTTKMGNTRERWEYAIEDKAFDLIRHRKLIETTPEQFLAVLQEGTVSTNVYLRRAHNYAMNMYWLPRPVLPKPNWPVVRHKERRGITLAEHNKIIDREHNPATRAFYQLLWYLGGSQTDVATLLAEDVDWKNRTVSYSRRKNGKCALMAFGDQVATIFKSLPARGQLFPALARIHERHRAKLFIKRLATVGLSGISLHSYRYGWAERAKEAGMPERFAMQALGQSSKAVHRAYAKKAIVKVPALEEYEKANITPQRGVSGNSGDAAHHADVPDAAAELTITGACKQKQPASNVVAVDFRGSSAARPVANPVDVPRPS